MEAFLWFIIIGWIICMLITYWPIAVGTIFLIILFKSIHTIYYHRKYGGNYNYVEGKYKKTYSVDINSMDGIEFENFIADLLTNNGYSNVHVTKASGDHGIDIIATNNGLKYGIQCKRYSSRVGNYAIHEAFSGAAFYDCDQAIVATNNTFTKSAIEEAKKIGVILWNGDKIHSLMNNASLNNENTTSEKKFKKNEPNIENDDEITEDEMTIITCPDCGVGIRVKKTNGKMLAIRCTRCDYKFFERT